jgi:thioredoxin-dependent peroxiredoxin
MAKTLFKGNPVNTSGDVPAVGSKAPAFTLVGTDLAPITLATYAGKKKIVSVFPSIDTPVCALSVKAFNEKAGSRADTVVINVSADLPFAHKRFCAAEGLPSVVAASTFRSSFGKDWGTTMTDGPLADLHARAVFVLDAEDKVLHAELVPNIGQEPNYDAALAALG